MTKKQFLCVFLATSAWIAVTQFTATSASASDSKFSDGDCFQDLRFAESWEPQEPIFKVVETGKKKYRVARWLEQEKTYSPNWESKTFIEVYGYSKVKCPK